MKKGWLVMLGLAGALGAGIVIASPGRASANCETRGSALFANDDLSNKGRGVCFSTLNGDGSVEVFFLGKKGAVSLVKDVPRCRGGAKHGQACRVDADCPSGECRTPFPSECRADAKGRTVFLAFNGNADGGNPDLGDELYVADTKKGGATRITTQGGWCSNDPSKACTTSTECRFPDQGTAGFCDQANVNGLQVSSDGRFAAFATDGDPDGGNPAHASQLYARNSKGKKSSLSKIGASGRFCSTNTANRDKPCTKDDDCGAECGDLRLGPGEQCDGGGCAQGQICGPPGTATQCQCQTPTCGNGIVEGYPFKEDCDGSDAPCSLGERCGAPGGPGACLCIPTTKPTCGNGILEAFEACDGPNHPCGFGEQCTAAGDPFGDCQCKFVGGTCGNGVLEAGEGCESSAPCAPGFTCQNCQCLFDPTVTCGNNVVDPGEQCDGTNLGACAPGFMCSGCRCSD